MRYRNREGQALRSLISQAGVYCAFALLFTIGFVGTSVASERWFRLEFADSRPPCLDVPEGARCIGTRPKTSVFEMRNGERLEMPTCTPLPPAWAAFESLWVYAPAAAGSYARRAIELAETPLGARLLIYEGDRHYLQSVPLARWVALETKNQPKLWVRVSAYSP